MIDIHRTQERLLEMAICVRDILDAHRIPYIITYGTLLGAIRHQGFIPWDDDFDFYLFDDTYEKAIEAIRVNLPGNMFLEDEKSEPLYFHGWAHVKDLNSRTVCELFPQDNAYAHHGLSLDLYKATRIPREQLTLFQLKERHNYLKRRLQLGLISNELFARFDTSIREDIDRLEQVILFPEDQIYGFMSLDGDYLEVNEVFPVKQYLFEGHLFWGPNNYHSFLTRCYGNYLELPPIEKRRPHYSDVVFIQ